MYILAVKYGQTYAMLYFRVAISFGYGYISF